MLLLGSMLMIKSKLGLADGIVILENYSAEWKKLYKIEEMLLRESIGEYAIDIQHIGSTSIPDMIAKPIIDIAMAIANFEDGRRLVEPIKNLGYKYKGENGIPRRHYFVKGDPAAYHLHLLEIDSDEWEKHIIFRDSLRKDKYLADEYARIKTKLAEKFRNDRLAYTEGKSDFVNYVLGLNY